MITTTNARIEVRTDTLDAFADVSRLCSGYAAAIKFTPAYGGGFFLAHRIEDPKYKALVIAPEPKWRGDIENEGWIIEYEITAAGLIAANPDPEFPAVDTSKMFPPRKPDAA